MRTTPTIMEDNVIKKLTLAVGVGAGYVLGAKAGRERYEQIVGKARDLAGKPAVQDFTSNVSQTASTVADKAKGTVNEKVAAVNDKVSGTGSSLPEAEIVDLGSTGAVTSTPTPVVTTTPITGVAPSVTAPDTY